MYVDPKSELPRAKVYFYQRRLSEAYAILRRFFDRLPFRVEPEHAEYMAYFCRILLELGKDFELKFYRETLEKLYRADRTPELGLQLALVMGGEGKEARQILEQVVKEADDIRVRARAMMWLARNYDVAEQTDKYKELIRAIPKVDDEDFTLLHEIWLAKIAIDEHDFRQADERLEKVFAAVSMDSNWYVHASAKVMAGYLALRENNLARARAVATEIREWLEGKTFRTLTKQLNSLEANIDKAERGGTVRFQRLPEGFAVSYQSKSLQFRSENMAEKLLLVLLSEKRLTKHEIVRALYRRSYRGPEDDKLIYYHVHSLRKIFRELGLPEHVLTVEAQTYQFQPEVESLEEA